MTEIKDLDRRGDYSNLYHDGRLRVSCSEDYDELYIYRDGQDEPEGMFRLSTGERIVR